MQWTFHFLISKKQLQVYTLSLICATKHNDILDIYSKIIAGVFETSSGALNRSLSFILASIVTHNIYSQGKCNWYQELISREKAENRELTESKIA